jgi:hypothetical protein
MPPILLCWPTTLEADASYMALEVEPSRQSFVSFVVVRQIAREEQFGKMASDMEVSTKQRCYLIPKCRKKLLPLTLGDSC